MIPDDALRKSVARMLEAKLAGDRRFVARTGARGFLRLTRSTSRAQGGLATVGPVSGGLRFAAKDRLVVVERCAKGYRVLVRARVAGEVLVLYDVCHADVESITPALLDVLGDVRA